MDSAPRSIHRPSPPLLEEGLIRAGFLPPLPRRVRLARRLRRAPGPGGPARRGTERRRA